MHKSGMELFDCMPICQWSTFLELTHDSSVGDCLQVVSSLPQTIITGVSSFPFATAVHTIGLEIKHGESAAYALPNLKWRKRESSWGGGGGGNLKR